MLTVTVPSLASEIKKVSYSHFGNFKGLFNPGLFETKRPVIIYNYDEYLDFVGEVEARRKGYDMFKLMHLFESWGYLSFVPLERNVNVNPIKGAIKFLRKHPKVDAANIHMIGISQGAFLSLLAIDKQFSPKSLTLITPVPIHGKGKFSLPEIIRTVGDLDIPVLQFHGRMDIEWKRDYGEIMAGIMKQNNVNLKEKTYLKSKWWFWKLDKEYLDDIKSYLAQFEPEETIELTNEERLGELDENQDTYESFQY